LYKTYFYSLIEREFKISAMNPSLSEELLTEINSAINKEFKKMPRDQQMLTLDAYSFCFDHTYFN
jgi:hypothetical protein